jgi:putative spermidine/putrescine transport system ATP-binding protein/spermidine/putrescine transport system ATP-binding protein
MVAASIYQGGHVDLYIDAPEASAGRILMRLNAREANSAAAGVWSSGTKIAVAISSEDAVAFPPAGG